MVETSAGGVDCGTIDLMRKKRGIQDGGADYVSIGRLTTGKFFEVKPKDKADADEIARTNMYRLKNFGGDAEGTCDIGTVTVIGQQNDDYQFSDSTNYAGPYANQGAAADCMIC